MRGKRLIPIILIITVLTLSFALSACKKDDPAEDIIASTETDEETPIILVDAGDRPVATIIVTGQNGAERTIKVVLYPEYAPLTVARFTSLANDAHYDGFIFHRIIRKFMIQGGGYYVEDETLKSTTEVDSLYGEFSDNGWTQNTLSHKAGVLSMARGDDKDSASDQFFICSVDYTSLNGKYAAFGACLDSLSLKNVVDLSYSATYTLSSMDDFPMPLVTIKSIRVA